MRPIPAIIAALGLCLGSAGSLAAADDQAGLEFYTKQVEPILAKACYKCHGPEAAEKKKVKGKYRADSWEGLAKGGESGKPSVVPGDLDKSTLVTAIRWKDEETRMPPKEKLADADEAILEKWVKMGAPHPGKK